MFFKRFFFGGGGTQNTLRIFFSDSMKLKRVEPSFSSVIAMFLKPGLMRVGIQY